MEEAPLMAEAIPQMVALLLPLEAVIIQEALLTVETARPELATQELPLQEEVLRHVDHLLQ